VSTATLAYDPSAPALDVANVESIFFLVPPPEASPVAFDFCISELSIQ
jgi:hypothetical protein